ncbi:MAG: hypothetical protein K8R46_00765 [Pirellulales bacterium]|nr:hypothetical protein [Pirellulales bacterium]
MLLGLFAVTAGMMLLCSGQVFAGGAVAKRKQGAGQQQQMMQQQQMLQKQQQERQMAAQKDYQERVKAAAQNPDDVKDIVDLESLLFALDSSSRPWQLIIDYEAKEEIVRQYIGLYQRNGIAIKKNPVSYVPMIDDMFSSSPALLERPFANIIRMLAVIEYDFDNGQNKDMLALEVLGSKEAAIQNRQRLGMP